jgi:DNA-binding GntR family transcriptional regulator
MGTVDVGAMEDRRIAIHDEHSEIVVAITDGAGTRGVDVARRYIVTTCQLLDHRLRAG